MDFLFFINAVAFGVGLAMDAFSVSVANGLNEPGMKRRKMFGIAGIFAGFQILMPLLGWICVHTVATLFESFQRFIPWIALALLGYIGGKMLYDGICESRKEEHAAPATLGILSLLVQGIATSIDALSVGFTISEYQWAEALTESLIIGVVTFLICLVGVRFGRSFGDRLTGKASLLGGIILIAIGLEIVISSFF